MTRPIGKPASFPSAGIFALGKSAIVGVAATGVDLLALLVLVELVGVSPIIANVPALLLGALVQFVGCRHFAFRAYEGSITRQAAGFAVTEIGTLALNALLFHLLVTVSPIPYAICRPLGQFVVFLGFSYPMWRRVFRR